MTAATADFGPWQQLLNSQELNSENWLLAYEANVKGWLDPLPGIGDYVQAHPHFGILKASGVSFYDTHAKMPLHKIAAVATQLIPDEISEPNYADEEPSWVEDESEVGPEGLTVSG